MRHRNYYLVHRLEGACFRAYVYDRDSNFIIKSGLHASIPSAYDEATRYLSSRLPRR